MKQINIILLIVIVICSCEKDSEGIQFVEFSDDTFYAWCLDQYDLDGDQELSFR